MTRAVIGVTLVLGSTNASTPVNPVETAPVNTTSNVVRLRVIDSTEASYCTGITLSIAGIDE